MMRSFLKVCSRAGFSKDTRWLYWKMFFTVLFRNPKGVETAVNLATMFLHFRKQKDYIITTTDRIIADLEKNGEEAFNKRMLGQTSEVIAGTPD